MHFLFVGLFIWMLGMMFSSQKEVPTPQNEVLTPQEETIKEISFEARTRGSAEIINITPTTISVEKTGNLGPSTHTRAISEQEWQKVLKSLQGVTLEHMAQLPAPTQQRQRDAAMHAQISITTSSKTYTSSTFDDHHAPKLLQPLMKVIDELSKEKK